MIYNVDRLVRNGQAFLSTWSRDVASERGDVPWGVTGVLGGLALRPDLDVIWDIGRADRERLGVWPSMPSRVQVWAGLRVVNEVAQAIHQVFPELDPNPDFWTEVIGAYLIGLPFYLSGSPDDPRHQTTRQAAAEVVEAACQLGPVTSQGFGKLVTAPDIRLRRVVGKSFGIAYVTGVVGLASFKGYQAMREKGWV